MKQNLLSLFLAMLLLVGGEYEITHTSGRVSYCKIVAILADGDYVINHPTKIYGFNSGRIPIVKWSNEQILLSYIDISEARILRLPRKQSLQSN
jgi:hypothetical protein